jgi:hypothetical protein
MTTTIKLTDAQLKDLRVFLERVELRGIETQRFISILQTIQAAVSASQGGSEMTVAESSEV